MPRSAGTYTAPSNSFNPAVEGTAIDETDWNSTLDDIEAALTESVYTGGLGSTDNQLVRTDGTDTKKVQGTGITVDDSNNVSGVTSITATTINVGNADTSLTRTGAGDIAVEGNAIYRAGGTDVPIADGGTGASTAAGGARALLEGLSTTQGALLYRDGSQWTALAPGASGEVLQSGGTGGNPSWTAVSGTGDVTAASGFGTDNRLIRSDGTGKGVQSSAITVDDSGNVSGVGTLAAGNTTITGTIGTSGAVTVGTTSATAPKIDPSGFVELPEISAPSTPASGFLRLYAKTDGKTYQKDDAGTETDLSQAGGGSSVNPNHPQGRLTLETGVPVSTSNQSAKGTLYYTPHLGNGVWLYDGSSTWSRFTFSELSIALSGGTASRPHDVFIYDNSGTPALELTAWTNDTTRATSLTRQDGRLVKSGATTRLYLGTIYLDSSKQCNVIFGGTASGGTDGVIGLWNLYNQEQWQTFSGDTTDSWTYTDTANWRAANNSSTMRTSFVVGVTGQVIDSSYNCICSNSGASGRIAIAYDSTTSPSDPKAVAATSPSAAVWSGIVRNIMNPGVGYHYVTAVELGSANVTFFGDVGLTTAQSGLQVMGRY